MIVVGVDGSSPARAAVEWASDDTFRMRQTLRIVHVIDHAPTEVPATRRSDVLHRRGQKILAEALTLARDRQPDIEVMTELIEGDPSLVLRGEGERAIEIVVGSRGLGGFAGALLGSVTVDVAEMAACPVVVVREGRPPAGGEVVVGFDGSAESEPALLYALERARFRGTALHAVCTVAPESGYGVEEVSPAHLRVMRERLEALRERYPQMTILDTVRYAPPVDALSEASAGADLVVVGSHGRGVTGSVLLGSVGKGVLHQARCAVAIVRTARAEG